MQLNGLCCILPAGRDQIEPSDHFLHRRESDKKGHPPRGCHGQILALIRKLVSRFPGPRMVGCFRSDPPRKAYSGKFQDMAGIGLSYKVGGGNNPRIFSYAELYIGTNGFSEDEVLGSGGFGRVFKAVLPSDGTLVAVKCLAEKGEHFERTFAAELVAVANLRHRNLVRLRGWCVHEDQLLLVYDYMPNLSLDRVLFKRPENPNSAPLDWERRKRIARGLAAALFYLHEQLEAQIIHRDVKTSNVMLDSHYNARLGDFGLARWLEHDLEHHAETSSITGMRNHPFRVAETTRIGGTIGYLPPESLQKRYAATTKSDVFSFGVVVLEIASGRRAVDLSYPDDKIVLLDWVRRLADEGRLLQAGDARFPDGSYMLSEMELLLHLGLLCTLHDPKSRPDMRWVLGTLSGNVLGKLPALPSFKSHPRYISLSSPNNTSTSRSATVTVTDSSATTVASTSTIYITATGRTIFVTADPGDSNTESARRQLKPLPMVETPREISFKEIVLATNNFSEDHRVAEVDFGTAYHGFLKGRRHVMVKRLGIKTCPALRARFSTELQNLGRLRHRNLVQLRGWCTEQGEMLVIYDFLASRLLSHLLFHQGGRNCSTILQWHHRYNIIRSLASAILYLHEEWEEQVIHRHITSSSIVIDHDENPRLTSFGLAEFLTRNEHGHHIVTDKSRSAQGIFGYISPEYLESGEANTAADIYSFGVVVLEVISGQMAVDFRHPEVLLVRRIHKFEVTKRPLLELADQQLDGKYDHQEFLRLAKLGMACTRSDPDLRPSIRQIVSILDGNEYSFIEVQKERTEEWRQRNAAASSLVRRIQALGIQ
ncbi:hypothetical protein Nepgr_009868 [Nepenthes gracilis]|uniref:Protein kinase domain-containing protein n=1 Tax=Nepenthes gracilis TaxID=150966 RepID=A0AAD3SBA0_NEPGR|nr:hypothetical protein Nepgr_009868 [Nepenthes gracilis]